MGNIYKSKYTGEEIDNAIGQVFSNGNTKVKDVKVNGTSVVDGNKTANITVPTKTSNLENDSGFLTEHQDISGKADKSSTYTKTEVDNKLGTKVDVDNQVGKKYQVNGVDKGEIFNNYTTNVASGFVAHAEGSYVTASGDYSHAEGGNTTASGSYSHSEGSNTVASGSISHAEGGNTQAIEAYSHAEGGDTQAKGNYSHAEGRASITNGSSSHAEGYSTQANGICSHTEGDGTIASGNTQHVQGAYNIEDTANKYVDIIGNGSNSSSRSNASTVDWSGNAWFAGTIKIGGTSQDDEVAKELATKSDIDNKVDKVTGKGLSTNDFSNYYKGTVDDNTARIIALDNDIDNKVDKITGKGLSTNDFTDNYKALGDALQFIELDNVITTDSLITSGGFYTWDGDYETKEHKLSKKADKTYVDDKINTKADKSDAMITDTASGTTAQTEFAIKDNAINYEIFGNSIQKTRSGKNILPFPYFFSTITLAGVTFTVNDDGTVILDGTSTSSVEFLCAAEFVFSKPGTYSYALGQTDSNILGCVNQYDSNTSNYIKSMNSGETTFQITENDISDAYYYIISIYVKTANAVFNKVKVSPQLEISSEPTSYEQYGATPSPDYPSEIECVGDLVTDTEDVNYGKYKVITKVTGKNLFNINASKTSGMCNISVSGNVATVTTTNSVKYVSANIPIPNYESLIGKTITVKANVSTSSTNTGGVRIGWVMPTGAFLTNTETDIRASVSNGYVSSGTISAKPNDTATLCVLLFGNFDSATSASGVTATYSNIQIELGSTATEYEPYRESTITAYLDQPLRKIGDYADYIDFEKQKVVRNTGYKQFDGTESWTMLAGTDYNIFYTLSLTRSSANYISSIAMSNRYTNGGGVTYKISLADVLYVFDTLSSVNDFKSQLAVWNTAGNPLKVYYALATPTEESITLSAMPLEGDLNNIFCTTTTPPSNIEVTYYQNPTMVINSLKTDTQAQISRLWETMLNGNNISVSGETVVVNSGFVSDKTLITYGSINNKVLTFKTVDNATYNSTTETLNL